MYKKYQYPLYFRIRQHRKSTILLYIDKMNIVGLEWKHTPQFLGRQKKNKK